MLVLSLTYATEICFQVLCQFNPFMWQQSFNKLWSFTTILAFLQCAVHCILFRSEKGPYIYIPDHFSLQQKCSGSSLGFQILGHGFNTNFWLVSTGNYVGGKLFGRLHLWVIALLPCCLYCIFFCESSVNSSHSYNHQKYKLLL